MITIQAKYFLILFLLICSSLILEAQNQKGLKKISKEFFKNLNKIPFEITRYKVNNKLKVKEIKGWSPENYDCGAKSIYLGFVGVADEGTVIKLIGSGFGAQQGNGFINCTEQKIKLIVTSWNDKEINLKVHTIDKFFEARKVTITITNDSFEQLSVAFDALGILKVKNSAHSECYYSFGQNMWTIAKNRLNNELSVPESPITMTAAIDESYEPKLWDCVIFDNYTMGILIKVSSKSTEIIDGEEQHTWSVILEEMNTKCIEKRSVVICKFQVGKISEGANAGKFGILLNISSNSGANVKAIGYYR